MFLNTIDNTNFESLVINNSGITLLDFWAPWCGPCRMLTPIIEELAENFKDKVTIGKVNVVDNRELALKYNISAIPTILIFKNGKLEKQIIGLRDLDSLTNELNSLL